MTPGIRWMEVEGVGHALLAEAPLEVARIVQSVLVDEEGEWEKDKKFICLDELWPIFKACKESKERGGFHDYMEILKLYDKNNDDSMQGNDLFKLLTTLGEKLTKEEAKTLMKDLCDPADDDGFIPFKRE